MIKEAISNLVSGKSLNMAEAAEVMEEIMTDKVTPAQFGAFVTALRMKGETADEIAGMAKTMRAKAVPVKVSGPVVDTCGTGGDSSSTFNISTTAAFVVAGAGLKVAKHGNRAISSQSGSADVLEALGVRLDLTAEEVARCLEEVGIGFMFAPAFHPAMKFAGAPRREIGIRTVFNILGPLTNPAGAQAQVLGVADGSLVEKMAQVLKSLGCRHALVVHGADGLDEITVTAESNVCELTGGRIVSYTVSTEELGLPRAGYGSLKGGTAAENAAILREVLGGVLGHRRDVVLVNAAAALVAGDKAISLKEGIELAKKSIDGGQASLTLERMIDFCRRLPARG
ncbi:MAG: anthranilate phosphoribosyltransferase [Chloroflexi bacterium]|nr:anthranilate phosphoribosyltransferase [Chloroflexota bacterium]